MLKRASERDRERRAWHARLGLRALRTLGGLSALFAAMALALAGQALAEGITNSADDLRDGWYPEQSSLTPSLVSGGTFGEMWSATVDGQVFAQPLLANGRLLVVTENNKVYALDPATGAARWATPLDLGQPWKSADISCGDIAPNVGVTATPVIDPGTNTAYLTHKTYASGTSGPALWYMDAVNMETGKEKAGFPVLLTGAAQNQPGESFQPTNQLQRPGLLLMNGVVYAGFGSDCDRSPWKGWIFGVSTAGQVKARWVAIASGDGAGIWQSGSGLASDGAGVLLIATGNHGSPSTPTPGNSPPASLGESIVRLVVQADGSLKPINFFTPFDAAELDAHDADFASGGVTGLNNEFFGTLSLPHLAVAVGKDGYVYLLNREELGGFKQGAGGGDKVVDRIGPYGGVWSRPGVWPGEGGWVYIPTASPGFSTGQSGFLRAYQYGVSGTGQPTLALQATSSDGFGFGSGAPVITSNGTNPGSALVWIEWAAGSSGTGGQLRVYDPIPVGGKPVLRHSWPIGTESKFATPGVGAGRLYVGTRDGKVLAFGSPVTAPLTGPATDFETTTIGNSSHKTLTLTATTTLTVTALSSSSSQFTVGTPSPALPATLSAGQTIQVPLTFTPTQTGLIGGTLTAETSKGANTFSMSGTGQSAGAQLSSNPTVLSFGGTTVGGHLTGTATFSNVGSASLTINKVILPVAPFGATGVPAVGSKIEPGSTVTVNVTFEPTAEGSYSSEIAMETTGGNASVALTGSAGPPGSLAINSEQNQFGEVEVGRTQTKSFTITNTGGTNVTINRSKPPSGGAFSATTSLAEGTTIAPGESLTETVAFAPTSPGYTSASWSMNANDTTGLHEVLFNGTGTLSFGKTSVGASSDTFAADRKRVNRYALPSAGTVSKLSIYLAPTSTSGQQLLKGVVYGDSSGAPGALLGVSEQLTFKNTNAAGWYDLRFASALKLAAGNYWIGIITGATTHVAGFRYTSVAGSRDYNANVYTSGPSNPFGTVTNDAEQASLYATYLPETATVPANTAPPTITGTAQQGQTLTEVHGSWTNNPTSFAYQWQQCDGSGNSCLPISGATTQMYAPLAADVGHTLRVQETATNASGTSGPASSAATAVVLPPPPVNTAPPTITGTAQEGQTLTEVHGSWTNSPTGYSYQWLQCDSTATSCLPISGAKGQTYKATASDVGHTVEVQETASNAGGAGGPATSSPTAVVVAPPPPANTAPPTITGTAQQGHTLTEAHGAWTNEPTSFTYQWLQCDGSGNNCSPIAAAASQTYLLVAGDVGHTLKVQETASNGGGPSSPATSVATNVVVPAAPANTSPPTITGTAQQGETLTEAHGAWTNEPTSFTYQWLQCDGSGNNCSPISAATSQTYLLVAGDVGHRLKVQETATNPGGTGGPATSLATAVIVPPAPVNTSPPTITGTAQEGQTLTEVHGSWTNSPTSFAYEWLQCDSLGNGCLPISGAKSQTYTAMASDVGHTLEVQETATNAGGTGGPATSGATAVVAAVPVPENTGAPTITGTAQTGQTLTAHNGSWTNEPTGFTYAWQRCDAVGANCSPIGAATATTYLVASADVGATLRVAVTASNAGGNSAPASSAQTAVVVQGTQTFGKTTAGASSDSFLADRKRVSRYALPAAGSVTKLSIYLAPTSTSGQQLLKGVLYADTSSAPGALLGVSEQLTFKSTEAAGWYDLPLAKPLKLAAGNYWIGIITGATSHVAGFRYTSVAGARDYNTNTYTAGPTNPFGAVTTDAEQSSLYATYTPG